MQGECRRTCPGSLRINRSTVQHVAGGEIRSTLPIAETPNCLISSAAGRARQNRAKDSQTPVLKLRGDLRLAQQDEIRPSPPATAPTGAWLLINGTAVVMETPPPDAETAGRTDAAGPVDNHGRGARSSVAQDMGYEFSSSIDCGEVRATPDARATPNRLRGDQLKDAFRHSRTHQVSYKGLDAIRRRSTKQPANQLLEQ